MNEIDNNTQDQAAEATSQPAPVNGKDHRIQSVDEFGDLLFNWHNKQVATVRHLLDVPVGTEVRVGETEEITLDGDTLKGYKLGLELGLSFLGTLPFAYTPEAVAEEQGTTAEAEEDQIDATQASSVH